jgi:hypothetical protein
MKRKKQNSLFGFLIVPFLGFAILLGIFGRGNKPPPASAYIQEVSTVNPQQQEVPTPPLPLPSIPNTLPVTQLTSASNKPDQRSDQVPQPATSLFDVANIDAVRIFTRLDLMNKGFELKKHEAGSRARWTLRKTDETREYTAVFLIGANNKTTAVTLEIVGTGKSLDELSRSYFSSFLSVMLPKPMADNVNAWLQLQGSTSGEHSADNVIFYLSRESSFHRRLTLQTKT